jgi:hypothetical protein
MRSLLLLLLGIIIFSLEACEFSCQLGSRDEKPTSAVKPVQARTRNGIALKTNVIDVEKAYLLFEDGSAVPEDNVVDFSQAIKLLLVIEKGWVEKNNKVSLGSAEKIVVEGGEILLDEKDLFAISYPEGMDPAAAKRISLTASIRPGREIRPLTDFLISFRVWDKNGDGFVEGSYKLYAK